MTMVQYNVQAGANGSILIPTTPFAIGEEVEVVLRVPKESNGQAEQRRKAAEVPADLRPPHLSLVYASSHLTPTQSPGG